MDNLFSLDGKVALITGASRGLGQGMAVGLAKAGATIIGVGTKSLEETKAKIDAIGGTFYEVITDLSQPNAAIELADVAFQKEEQIDILVNNAGIIHRSETVNFSDEDWYSIINVNQHAVFQLSREVGKHMLEAGTGKIINIASMLSFQGGLNVPAYTASKHAVAGLTKALANEWSSKGINVNAIAPGYMATDNTAPLRNDENRSAYITSRIPQGRWGTPEDLAGAAIYLASEASNYVNGHILCVDGGWMSS
ncbi:2-dehydro-3-deoxy-D-gluconate 5-dehydrogenase KduD [Pseudalkalibacillus hwajinpoensis]|uniref:2-dehydro-3-deoxy-D-gluconate 5-dehydrogenase KduD n=1 Tax=Guptibacillus hwajinpoensis TaxID=208199 RepID=UPI001CD1D1EA|nr:2-dehydro-3-deoxy-D-gluconate 5-dehydrogenase KduD [Pseudalkalibacillus hwajinpoensis]MCA0991343.1 2-dehydro-3-deoxy-D-gluconate 5-dehydrogenase KduD [Pseudalkalibacillus hwajinpoensis]